MDMKAGPNTKAARRGRTMRRGFGKKPLKTPPDARHNGECAAPRQALS
jgi:hypothetical protein